MTDDERRPLSEAERARAQLARTRGGLCAACGRTFAGDEPVWCLALFVGRGNGPPWAVYWRVPVGRECVPSDVLREAEGREPGRCGGCGRAVFYAATDRPRRLVSCSLACRGRARAGVRREDGDRRSAPGPTSARLGDARPGGTAESAREIPARTMADDAPCQPTDEERARMYAARTRGGMCARCGRGLAEGETVWMERLTGGLWGRRRAPRFVLVPVGAECASASFRAATAGTEPVACVGCGRGVYVQPDRRRRRRVACSRRCSARAAMAGATEPPGS